MPASTDNPVGSRETRDARRFPGEGRGSEKEGWVPAFAGETVPVNATVYTKCGTKHRIS
jgi:hypothetical protein